MKTRSCLKKEHRLDLGSTMSEETRRKPMDVASQAIEISDEILRVREEVISSIDVLSANNLDF